jgi:hypothetical protein
MKVASLFEEYWITGHNQPVYNDLDIFWAFLSTHLDTVEKVEADVNICEAPLRGNSWVYVSISEEKHQMMNIVWASQETASKRFEQ